MTCPLVARTTGATVRLAVAALVAALLAAPPARAAPPEQATVSPPAAHSAGVTPLEWRPGWRKFGTLDFVLTGVALATAGVSMVAPPRATHWDDIPGVDTGARTTLRATTADGRETAKLTSDILLGVLASYPFAIDGLIVAGWQRESADIAVQIALIDIEAMAVIVAVMGLTKTVASRVRPYASSCGQELEEEGAQCTGRDRFRSFFSGHAALAFGAAALVCSHQIHHDLYDNALVGALVCGAGFALAGTTGVLRVVADEHYLTDVLVGGTIGTLLGLGLPWLLHYQFGDDPSPARPDEAAAPPTGVVTLSLVPTSHGFAAIGTF